MRAARLSLPPNQFEGGFISSLTNAGKVSPLGFLEDIRAKKDDGFGERSTVTFSILLLASSFRNGVERNCQRERLSYLQKLFHFFSS